MERPQKKLTDRQKTVLNFITDHIEGTGFPPTIREIGDHLDISSTNGVNDHLKALEKKGYLTRQDAKSRAMTPLFRPDGEPFNPNARHHDPAYDLDTPSAIPIVGRIAAGAPITAIEHVEEHVSVGENLIGQPTDVFGLVVKGDSMIEAGIYDGDYIFIKKGNTARNGQIIAAMVDGEATVKTFFKESGRIRLQPENASMEPIFVEPSEAVDMQILGKVIGVFRKM